MMVVSLHDRISGHAARARSLDRFLAYARAKTDVWFARKDEIAKWALQHRAETPVVRREGPEISTKVSVVMASNQFGWLCIIPYAVGTTLADRFWSLSERLFGLESVTAENS